MWPMRSRVPRSARRYGSADGALAAHVEAEAAEPNPRRQHMLDQEFGVGRFDSELRRQIRFRRRVAERQPNQDLDVGGQPGELLRLDGIVDDERANAGDVGVVDVGRLLDRVGVDAAVDRESPVTNEIDLAAGRHVESARRRRRRRAAPPGGTMPSPRSAGGSPAAAMPAACTVRRRGRGRAPAAECRAARRAPASLRCHIGFAACHAAATAGTDSPSTSSLV